MRIVTLLTYVTLVISSSVTAECDTKSCPHRYYMSHYTELGCKPIYEDPETCCPARFDCSAREGLAADRCHYEGTEFKIGETLPENLTPTCLVNCRCVQDYMNESVAVPNCVNIECPEDLNGPQPGCIPLYEEKECCSTDMFCGNETEAEVTCEHNGNTYVKGQKFYPDEEPCMTCICQSGFNGSLIEPHCEIAKCNVELHYSSEIHRHCVPVYYQDRCCPIDWICPDDIDVSKIQVHRDPTTKNNLEGCPSDLGGNKVCHFGSLKFEQGEELPAEIAGSCVKCECAVPPVPTCVKNYDNC